MNILFTFEKETKGTYRFKENGDDPIIGTIYIKKSAIKNLGITEDSVLSISISKEG